LKKRNKNDAAALPEKVIAPEEISAQPDPEESLQDINRALSQALASVSDEEKLPESDAAPAPMAEPPASDESEPSESPEKEPEIPDRQEPEEAPPQEPVPEEESAPQTAEEPKPKSDSPAAAVLRITLPLTIICIAVALMLAVVNLFTADTIAGNAAREKENAVRAIFTQAESVVSLDGAAETYLAVRGTEILGSCISLSENGFGGAISMMVGLDPAGSVCGVRIVSMSETPGFGTRAKNDSFLAGFRGRDPFVIGENFDALSGATITSKAVVAGVNRAMSAMPDLQAEAAQRGLTVADAGTVPEVPQDAPVTDDPQADTPETEQQPAETDSVVLLPTPVETEPAAEDSVSTAYVNLAAVIPTDAIVFRSASTNRVTVVSSETVYVAETEEPVETEPSETEPVETEPVETEPAETEPVETEPVETEPAETEPVETEPVETEPSETEPVETEPVETESAETEPVETEPVETESAETEPVETEPVETESAETDPVETEPVETEPAETEPVETEPVETEPAETEPVETEPAETLPEASGV